MNRLRFMLAISLFSSLSCVAYASSDAPQNEAPPATRLAPLSSFSEVVNRPLFARDRKPKNRPTPVADAQTAPVLSAIVVLKDRRYAVFQDPTQAAGRRVSEGDSIGSLTVRKIRRDHVVTTAIDGGELVIPLFSNSADGQSKAAQRIQGGSTPAVAVEAVTPESAPMPVASSENRPPKPLITPTP